MTSDDAPADNTDNDEFTIADFKEWADRNSGDFIDQRDNDNSNTDAVVTWGDGREVALYENGEIVLKQHRALGGAEPEDTIELQGNRLVVTDYRGDEHRVSYTDFPIEQ